MLNFISEEHLIKHTEYLKGLKLRYSILEKSVPELKGKKIFEIARLRIDKIIRAEALSLLTEIELHELYFSSFGNGSSLGNAEVRGCFGSEANFLYELKRLAMKSDWGFVGLKRGRNGLELFHSDGKRYCEGMPILAIDVCEHAYYGDYGFEKELYLKNALMFLNLDKVSKND